MLRYQKIDVLEGTDVIKLVYQKNMSFDTIGFLKILDLNLKNTFVINVMINDSLLFKGYSNIKSKRRYFEMISKVLVKLKV